MTSDEERTARYLEGAAPGSMESDKYAAALIRRLRVQRDDVKEVADSRLKTILRLEEQLNEARNKALDEAAKAALAAWEEYPDDGSYIAEAILALKTQEPKPLTPGQKAWKMAEEELQEVIEIASQEPKP